MTHGRRPLRSFRAPGLRTVVFGLVTVATATCSDATGPGAAPEPITELPRQLSASEERVLAASNDFAFALSPELLPEGPDENLFWSPLSASMLLGMILNGADGDSFDQIRSVLGFDGMTQEEINAGYRDLIDLLVGLDPRVTVAIGNSTWTAAGFPLLPDFQERVAAAFDAEARSVDFGDPGTLEAINGWVEESTNGLIETLFEELPANAVLVLVNAIYFQGDWTAAFDREETRRGDFTRPDGSTVQADLMERKGKYLVGSYDDVTLVDLPYGGRAFSMTVVVPRAGVAVGDVVGALHGATWASWIDGLAEVEAVVTLPRIELEWDGELDDPLKAVGMTDPFDPGRADFGRLTPGGGVWLGLVKQKAFVTVDEEGTEAAAASGGVVVDSGPLSVRADRPFLFVLRERLTGTVLFMGVVHDPTG